MKRALTIAVLLTSAAGLIALLLWSGHGAKSSAIDHTATLRPVGQAPRLPNGRPAPGPSNAGKPSGAAAEATAPRPATVPERVRQIVQPDAAIGYSERVKAARALGTSITPEEAAALYAYLGTPASVEPNDQPKEDWLRNELMDRLVVQEPLPAGLAELLVSIYQDRNQDEVLRDYSIQHMSEAYKRMSDEYQAVLLTALQLAAEETGTSIAGTALLALYEVAQTDRRVEPAKLCQTALKLAGDNTCGELSRITAVQVCARLRLDQAGSAALQIAQEAQSVPLRTAAIAALGEVGNEQARGYLRQLASAPEPRLLPAITTALRKMNHRLGN